jgi:hypothetical protein
MIIYQAQPNRIYPIIIDSLSRKYCNLYTFKHIFNFKNSEDENSGIKHDMIYYSSENLMVRSKKDNHFFSKFYREGFPENNSKQDIDVIHGIFCNNKYKKNKKDFRFTFIDHPLDQIYNFFFYLKHLHSIYSKTEKFEIFPESYSGHRGLEDLKIYRNILNNSFLTLENYIDNFIFNKGKLKCSYNNLTCHYIDEIFHASFFDEVDFCGLINTEENLFKSTNKLSKFLFIEELDMDKYKPISSITKKSNYRIKELEVLLEKDIEFFKKKEEQLND